MIEGAAVARLEQQIDALTRSRTAPPTFPGSVGRPSESCARRAWAPWTAHARGRLHDSRRRRTAAAVRRRTQSRCSCPASTRACSRRRWGRARCTCESNQLGTVPARPSRSAPRCCHTGGGGCKKNTTRTIVLQW